MTLEERILPLRYARSQDDVGRKDPSPQPNSTLNHCFIYIFSGKIKLFLNPSDVSRHLFFGVISDAV